MKLKFFFCQFQNPWALRVSGMGGYTSKCEKSQNHCTLLPMSAITSEILPWGRLGCYEGVYWPLSQLRYTWYNLKDYNLLNWEARFPWTNGPSGWPSASPGCFWASRPKNPLSLWGQKTFFLLIFNRRPDFLDQLYFMLAFTSHGWFWLCFGWPG